MPSPLNLQCSCTMSSIPSEVRTRRQHVQGRNGSRHTTLACRSYGSSSSKRNHSTHLGSSSVTSAVGVSDEKVTGHDTSAPLRERDQTPHMSSVALSTVPLATAGSATLEVWLYTAANLPPLVHQLSPGHSSLINNRYSAELCLWKEVQKST